MQAVRLRSALLLASRELRAGGVKQITLSNTKSLTTSTGGAATKHDGFGTTEWKFERTIAVSMLGLFPAAALVPCQAVDMGLAVVVPLHGYLGLMQIITDYVHGAPTPFVKAGATALFIATVGGLVYFNLNDVGITEGVKQIWKNVR